MVSRKPRQIGGISVGGLMRTTLPQRRSGRTRRLTRIVIPMRRRMAPRCTQVCVMAVLVSVDAELFAAFKGRRLGMRARASQVNVVMVS